MYAKGMSVRDIQATLQELCGGDISPTMLSAITDLQARGVQDIFIACMDDLSGFKEAVLAVFLLTQIQRCVIHQIRNSLK